MPSAHDRIWRRLREFEIGPADSTLTFDDRLARENGWSPEFARRVAREYLRFVTLCAVSEQPLTPSDAVDQAWHLHLAYTHSYWEEMCRGILGRPLHHGPTRGGTSEGRKFRNWYTRTLQLYEEVFDEKPPADIWPDEDARFADVESFRRVNTAQYLLLSRRVVASVVGCGTLLIGSPLLLSGCGWVSEMTGWSETFTRFLGALFAVSLVLYVLFYRVPHPRRGRGEKNSGGYGGYGGCGGGCGGCGS